MRISLDFGFLLNFKKWLVLGFIFLGIKNKNFVFFFFIILINYNSIFVLLDMRLNEFISIYIYKNFKE